jgi:hypothetical protein
LVFCNRWYPRMQEDTVGNQVDLPGFRELQLIQDCTHLPSHSEGTIAPIYYELPRFYFFMQRVHMDTDTS